MDQATSTGNSLMNMLPIILLSCGALLLFVIIAYFMIRKGSAKSEKTQLKDSLRKSGAKNTKLGKTAYYQKIYLALATTPVVNRYLFKVMNNSN